jgi:hypothetical protein
VVLTWETLSLERVFDYTFTMSTAPVLDAIRAAKQREDDAARESVSRILCKAVDLFTFSGGFYRWGLMRSG